MVNRKIKIFDIINYSLLLLLSISTIYPFVNMLAISLSPMSEVLQSSFMVVPRKITFEAYDYVLRYGNLGSAYKTTIFITVVGTLINLVLTSLGAYVLSTKDVPGRKVLTTFVVITMIFNGGLIPTYMVVRNLNLVNTVWAMILPNAINTFWMIVMRNFMQEIPVSLRESARLDGCSEYRILLMIIMPLSLPIVATLSLFYGVMHWNEYYNAIIYVSRQNLKPLQVIIKAMYEQSLEIIDDSKLPPAVETVRACTVMLATLPILTVYPFVQKYFVKGMMVGAVKA